MTALRSTIELTNRLLARLKARRCIRLPPRPDEVRINLGCGLAVAPGWLNIDGSLNALVANMPAVTHGVFFRLTGARQYYTEGDYRRLLSEHKFIHHDLVAGIPLEGRVADYIFTSHFLEHLFWKDADYLLRECHRVLKPGGVLRISVPDLEYVVSLYAAGEKENMLRNYFFVDDDESYYARHKYMYDYAMLKEQLIQIGFAEVNRCEYRQGCTPNLELLDNRPQESLFVEAMKSCFR